VNVPVPKDRLELVHLPAHFQEVVSEAVPEGMQAPLFFAWKGALKFLHHPIELIFFDGESISAGKCVGRSVGHIFEHFQKVTWNPNCAITSIFGFPEGNRALGEIHVIPKEPEHFRSPCSRVDISQEERVMGLA
jgi:hypothetical protein